MKKLVKVPFDLEKAKAGAKIVTRDGSDVRIVCFDRGSDDAHSIIGLIMNHNGHEAICEYTKDGKISLKGSFFLQDLFILEEIEEEGPKFEPFQKVLVRDIDTQVWRPSLFSHYDNESAFKFAVVGNSYIQCIPYEGNEHLNGTNKKPE